MLTRRATLARLAAFPPALALGTFATPARAAEPMVYQRRGRAIRGADPVAYFTEGKPVEGDAAFTATHEGAAYKFASAEHRDMFVADPELWKIEDGKLYLNINRNAQSRFLENVPGYVRTADHNWPIIAEVPEATLSSTPPSGLKKGAQ